MSYRKTRMAKCHICGKDEEMDFEKRKFARFFTVEWRIFKHWVLPHNWYGSSRKNKEARCLNCQLAVLELSRKKYAEQYESKA